MADRPSRAPLLASLRRLKARAEVVPAGFHTNAEWARKWRLSRPYAFRLLTHGMEAGMVVCRSFRRKLRDGRTLPVPHYAQKQ